jgi:orotate phosphoribosyltransferase
MNGDSPQDELIRSLAARAGHFRLESGHHGDLWLDLDTLFLRPQSLWRLVAALATRLAAHAPEVMCGPLAGGAFLAQMIAAELGAEFCYAECVAPPREGALFSAEYRLPAVLRPRVRGKTVAVVDDVINAGSAVRSTIADLHACGARPVAIGALLVLGIAAAEFAAAHSIPLETVARRPSGVWAPADCPLCASGVPLEDVAGSAAPPAGRRLTLIPLQDVYAVCRLEPAAGIPEWATWGGFWSVSRSPDELSVVCRDGDVPPGVRCERGWRGWRLAGTFGLSAETGVLAALLDPLAAAGVSIFAVSTFDTDYLFVKAENAERAADVLRRCGHAVP